MQLQYDDQSYSVEPNETVLECLLRHGIHIPNSCQSGLCQSCMLRATDGNPGSTAQQGLRPAKIEQNYFLACCCKPTEDLQAELPDSSSLSVATNIVSIDLLTLNTARMRLALPDNYSYHAGQFLRVFHPLGESRNYSIASLPEIDDFLELHIKILPDGLVSNWLVNSLQVGDEINIGEAIGDCYYIPDKPQQSMLLMGTGTGLAPLYGVLRDAIHQQHQGDIYLYHGAHKQEDLYLAELLNTLATRNGIHYLPSFSAETNGNSENENNTDNIRNGRCNELALQDHPKLSGWRAYVCGNPKMVKASQRALFLAGVSMSEIYVDSFLPTNPA